MSRIRRYLSLLLLIFLLPSSQAIQCDSCQGKDCTDDGCKGDYCISSYSTPRFGSTVDEGVLVKGCLIGEMLTHNIKSRCYENEDNEEVCICDKDKCTSGKKKPKKERIEKVSCACTGGSKNGCKQGKCKGDLCYWAEHIDSNKVTKGCLDVSVPLLERRSIDSCMLPPMSGSMHALPFNRNTFDKDILNTESCVCATDECNKDRPFTIPPNKLKRMDSQKCNSTVRAKINGKEYATKHKYCDGEFCYRMKVNAGNEYYHSEGCATFNPKRNMEAEFGIGECATFKGNELDVLTCYKTTDKDAMKRLEGSVQNEEEENDEDETEEGDDEEIIDEEPQKGKDERSNGKKNEKKEEEEKIEKEEEEEERSEEKGKGEEEEGNQKNIGEKADNPTPTKHFVWMEPTEAPTPDESNATMITVFVLIILCICVAGITWKFQLHRKLMRANYDTVAGG